LEAEWNSKLHALSEAEQNYECQRQEDQLKVNNVQREQVLAHVSGLLSEYRLFLRRLNLPTLSACA